MSSTLSARYTRTAIALHWLIALLIFANFALAWGSEGLAREARGVAMGYHKSIGLSILVLSLVRLFWRLTHKAPPYEPTLKPWEITLAGITHWAFYALLVLIPLSGWGMSSAGEYPLTYFGLFDVPKWPILGNKAAGGFFHESHEILAFATIGLFVLHVAGALKHRLVDKDGTLARMLPH